MAACSTSAENPSATRRKNPIRSSVLMHVEQHAAGIRRCPCSFFRDKAQRCRELSEIAIRPEVREQIGVWAEEFAPLAESPDQAPVPSALKTEPR